MVGCINRLFLAMVMEFYVIQIHATHAKGSLHWSIYRRIHFSNWFVKTFISLYPNCMVSLWSISMRYIIVPFQVSKLYEVVPPILTELGKVICYDIGPVIPPPLISYFWVWASSFIYASHFQVKNPWPNVDAHSGVLLNHFGLVEARYSY